MNRENMDHATLLTLRIPDFEAAIRKAVEPALVSRPVVVATSFRQQGRVLAVCADARGAGVFEEMYYPAAKALCPDAAFFTPDRELAERAVRAMVQRALAYSPQVEAAGGGCVMLDTQGTEKLWGDSLQTAMKAQRDIREQLRLPLAAGLAARRPWSLLASRAAGDSGIREVAPGSEDDFLDKVPIAWIDGVTPKIRMRLMEMNIRMAGQLRQFGREQILRQFGSTGGDALWNVLHPQVWRIGAAEQAIVDNANDTIRVEAYLPEASVEKEKLLLAARTLAGHIAATLRRRALGAARLHLSLMHADGVMKSAFSATGGFVQDETVLADVTVRLLERTFVRRVRVARFWLTAEKLASPERQGVLFFAAGMNARPEQSANSGDGKTGELLHTLDRIRSRFGHAVVQPAALLHHDNSIMLPEKRRIS